MTEEIYAFDIKKNYGDKKVLENISLRVKRGEVIGLLGPNGAGKTTLFYIIIGLIRADGGKILLNDENIISLPIYLRAQKGLAYLPQESSIFRGMSVEENILTVLEIIEKSKKERVRKLKKLLREFSLEHLRKSPALALSGGERRRVEVARAVACEPKFILLDEPFAGIDPIAVGNIIGIIRQLKNRGIGVLITDHNVRETLKIVDKAYIVYEGKILTSGTAEEILADEKVKNVYLGSNFE
jgi:lipopolysaccharide export system ATP-binding protein